MFVDQIGESTHLEESFDILFKYRIKLNQLKCSIGVT